MPLTAAEQYLLELINRGRLDPLAEAARYGTTLNAGITGSQIDATAKQVLAPNELLNTAAADHSLWMLANDVFAHSYPDASYADGNNDPGDRMREAGYVFSGGWTWGENLAWSGTTGTMNLEAAIDDHHRGLFLSPGHRKNLMNEAFREIGIGQEAGQFRKDGTNWNASMLTEKFAKSGSDVFVTGVSYQDDGDLFYDIGEGRGSTRFEIGAQSVLTAATGGYALKVAPLADTLVEISRGGVSGELRLDLTQGNAKLDYLLDGPVLTSVSATIVSGIDDLRLLGVDDHDLTGDTAANRLTGNKGDNRLEGRAGDDTLDGGAGADTMDGGDGSDWYVADAFDFISDSGTGAGDIDVVSFDGDADMVFNLGLQGIERVIGAEGNDLINAGAAVASVHLSGGGGNDRVIGGAGHDVVSGGSAAETPLNAGAIFERLYLSGSFDADIPPDGLVFA